MKKGLLPFLLLAFFLGSCSEDHDGFDRADERGGITDGSGDYSSGSGTSNNPNGESDSLQAGKMTAGEWSDLNNWQFWQSLAQREERLLAEERWGLKPVQRYDFFISDIKGEPISNARITLYSNDKTVWVSKTNNKGIATSWAGVFYEQPIPTHALIEAHLKRVKVKDLQTFEQQVNEIRFSFEAPQNSGIDVAFLVDATGSMGDEHRFLQAELSDVINRIGLERANQRMRTACVFYRDKQDAYLTKHSDFSEGVNKSLNFIRQQSANGGGDFPEGVDAALVEAISKLSWDDNARTRLAFLILDAPPHEDTETLRQLHSAIRGFNAKGILLIPVSASGIDKQTEFLLREMAMLTGGTYTFITNHSGIGNDHLEPTIGEYEVEFLNDLLIRLVLHYSE